MLQIQDRQDARGRVRLIARHDVPVVTSFIARLARQHGHGAGMDAARLEADLFAPSPAVHGLVVERFSYVVGYALMRRQGPALLAPGLELDHLFVLEGSRGLGLGRQLVEAAIDFAKGAECDMILVGRQAENRRAQGFYGALGFEACEDAGQGFVRVVR